MKEQFNTAEEKFFGVSDPLGDIAQAKFDKEQHDIREKQRADFLIKVDKMIEKIKSENHKGTDYAAQDWECAGCGGAPADIDLNGNCMFCGSHLQEPDNALRWMAKRLIREENKE